MAGGETPDGAVGFRLPISFHSFPWNSPTSSLTPSVRAEVSSYLHRINTWIVGTWVPCQMSVHMK